MKLINRLLFFFLAITSGAVHARSSIDLADYELVFSDEFESAHDGTVVDPDKWSSRFYWGPYVTINAEEQLYVDTLGINSDFGHTPFSISDGVLTIEAVRATPSLKAPAQPNANSDVFANSPDLFHQPNYNPDNVEYLSGLLATTDSYNATHGYFEARLKFPEGQGLWPAFWLLNKTYVENSPEIDIVEFLGHKKNTVHHTMHYIDQADNYRTVSTPTFETTGPDYTADFHTYGVAWDPTRMRFFVDGKMVREVTDEDFLISTQSMYVILNLAVGGSWPGSPDVSTEFPAKFEIDYVRAYERKSQPTINQQVLDDEYVLMFSDEFNGSNLNANVWNSAFLWGPYLQINNEEQVYIDKLGIHQNHPVNPFEVSSGTLKIKAAPIAESNLPDVPDIEDPVWREYNSYQQNTNYLEEDGWTPEYSSGILTTYDEFKFVNGYAEARVKMPVGSGLWPAFWLLNGYYVGPSPEMDIMEVRGSEPSRTHHSYHYQNSIGQLQSSAVEYDLPGSDVSEFHTYGFQWDSERMVWYVDGVRVRELTGPEVSQQLSYVILNLAVGGNFVNDVGSNVTPAEMEVDWVRVWQIDGSEAKDNTDPETEITTPVTASVLEPQSEFTIEGRYSDNASELNWVRVRIQQLGTSPALYWNGSDWEAGVQWLDASLDGEGMWQLSGVDFSEPGRYRLRQSARDSAGNILTAAESDSVDITIVTTTVVDTTDPETEITAPSSGSVLEPQSEFTIEGFYSDNASELNWVRVRIQQLGTSPVLYWNGLDWEAGVQWLDASLDGEGMWRLSGVDFSEPGRYRLRQSARDSAGNVLAAGESSSVDVTIEAPTVVDITDPVADITVPASGSVLEPQIQFTVEGNYSDNASELNWVRVRIQKLRTSPALYWNGSDWVVGSQWLDATLDGAGMWQLSGVDFSEPGIYRLRHSARDSAGNVLSAVEAGLVDIVVE